MLTSFVRALRLSRGDQEHRDHHQLSDDGDHGRGNQHHRDHWNAEF